MDIQLYLKRLSKKKKAPNCLQPDRKVDWVFTKIMHIDQGEMHKASTQETFICFFIPLSKKFLPKVSVAKLTLLSHVWREIKRMQICVYYVVYIFNRSDLENDLNKMFNA